MELNKFAYAGRGTPATARPRLPPHRGNGRWNVLDDDMVVEVCAHFDDRQLARLANVDRRMRRIAHIAIQRCLQLSASQWAVFDAVLHKRESVLLMGAPGTGKSYLLKILSDRVSAPIVTASTGAAAEKIGASTIHSALGLGIGSRTSSEIVGRMLKPHNLFGLAMLSRIGDCRTLIIDEVSMLTAKLLCLAEEVLLKVRGPQKGLPQLIVSGDPMQLGAVGQKQDGAFYTAELILKLRPYVLTESFRQAENSRFLHILNAARLGEAKREDELWLRANFCSEAPPTAPKLFCRNYMVDRHNDEMLEALTGNLSVYTDKVVGHVPPDSKQPFVRLKVGARVLLNRNLPEFPSLHNGSCGTVTDCSSIACVEVNFDNGKRASVPRVTQEFEERGKVVGTRTYMPLILAWAVTVHRAQGSTLDSMYVDLSKCFEAGHVYVALSRVREASHVQADNLQLKDLNKIDKTALAFYNKCAERSQKRVARRKERARIRALSYLVVDDFEANAMMDRFEAGQM